MAIPKWFTVTLSVLAVAQVLFFLATPIVLNHWPLWALFTPAIIGAVLLVGMVIMGVLFVAAWIAGGSH